MQRPKKAIEGSRQEWWKKIDTPSFYVKLHCTICHTGTRATVSGDKNSQITTVDSDPACLFFWRSLSQAQNIRCTLLFSQLDSQMLSNSIQRGTHPVSNLIWAVIIRYANYLLFLICARQTSLADHNLLIRIPVSFWSRPVDYYSATRRVSFLSASIFAPFVTAR